MNGGPVLITQPGVARRLGKISVLVLLIVALLLVITGCGGVATPPGTVRQQVGAVSIGYPERWAVSSAADRPQGWDWAAQDVAGDAGKVQLAVDGDYSALDVDFATASLLGAAQLGSYPDFALTERKPVEVAGADSAVRVDFRYRVGKVDYEAVWAVARGDGPRTVVVQLSGSEPLDGGLVAATFAGMEVS